MIHPSALLSTLVAVAAIAGSATWMRFVQRGLENVRATAEVEKPSNAPRPVTDLAPGGDFPEETAKLQRMVQQAQDQAQRLEQENKDLRDRLAREIESRTPPPKPTDLGARLEEMRQLKFKAVPSTATEPLADIQARLQQAVAAEIPEDASRLRTRAYQAMGFCSDPFDFRQVQQNLAAAQAVGFYDAAANQLIYQQDADLKRPDGRERLMTALIRVLQAQNFPAVQKLPLATDHDDAARALRSLALGENAFYRIQWNLKDDYPKNLDSGAPPDIPQPAYVPLFFNEEYKALVDAGQQFVETLMQKGPEAVAAAFARPPRSTSEIFHPELYSSPTPFVPVEVALSTAPVADKTPIFQNTAGEMAIHFMCRVSMNQELSATIAEGWAGDRYAIYEGPPEFGDHVYWKTAWRSAKDGKEFFDGMRRLLMQRHVVPWDKKFDQVRAFVVTDPHRAIRLRLSPDQQTVSLINATDPAFAEALDAAFPMP